MIFVILVELGYVGGCEGFARVGGLVGGVSGSGMV